jgi:hypothetical protein
MRLNPIGDNENNGLCTVEFVPRDDTEGRFFAAEILGYLFGYAQLTNTRSLAIVRRF